MDIILPTTVDSLQYIILLTNGRHSVGRHGSIIVHMLIL